MRLVAALILLASATVAMAESEPIKEKDATPKQSIPIPLPVTITQEPAELERLRESDRVSRDHEEKDLEAQVRAATAAEEQIAPAWWQAIGGAVAAIFLVWTLMETRKTANAAVRQAKITASEAQPFLHPVVTHFSLHPEVDAIRDNHPYRPSITLKFRNIGKTPAMLQRAGVRLCLVEGDNFARPEALDNIPSVLTSDVIASGEVGGSRAWQYEKDIGLEETMRLAASGEQKNFMRFYVTGYVVYDDVFNTRHTRRFLLKVRQSGFQATRGGRPHNCIIESTIPEHELEGREA